MYSQGLPLVTEAQRRWGGDPSLVLLPGRLYYVAILGKEGDRTLVSLGGHRFAAEVVGDLPQQGRVAVTVREASPERIVLEQAPPPAALPSRSEADPIQHLLARMGLPARAEFIEVLPHLVRCGQPLTAENMISLQEAWARLAPDYPEALPALARIQAQGLPLLPETLEAASRLEAHRPLITADNLFRLAQSLVNLSQALEREPVRRGLQPLPDFTRALARSVASLPLPNAGHPAVARQVSSLLAVLATPVEALLTRLGSVPPRQAGMPDSGTSIASGLPEALSPSSAADEVLLRNAGSLRTRRPIVDENLQVQLRRLDVLLDRLVQHPEQLSPVSREALLHCKEAVHGVLSDLDAEHIGNLRLAPDPDTSRFLSFSLPIAWSSPRDQASLRIFYRHGSGVLSLDPRNARLAFRLSVAPLGTVEVDLRVLRSIVSCDVHTENEGVSQLAERAAPQLREGLNRLGYLVSSIHCTAGPIATKPPEGLPGLPSPEELGLVDLVV